MLNIEIQNSDNASLDNIWITTAAKQAYQIVATEPADCTIRVVGNDEGQELNRTYRHKDKPTNVLSFTYDDSDPEAENHYIGDIVLCYPVVEIESKQQGKRLEHHYSHLVVHGILHLCGYDHEKTTEAEKMEQLEIEILAKLNIENPYLSV